MVWHKNIVCVIWRIKDREGRVCCHSNYYCNVEWVINWEQGVWSVFLQKQHISFMPVTKKIYRSKAPIYSRLFVVNSSSCATINSFDLQHKCVCVNQQCCWHLNTHNTVSLEVRQLFCSLDKNTLWRADSNLPCVWFPCTWWSASRLPTRAKQPLKVWTSTAALSSHHHHHRWQLNPIEVALRQLSANVASSYLSLAWGMAYSVSYAALSSCQECTCHLPP